MINFDSCTIIFHVKLQNNFFAFLFPLHKTLDGQKRSLTIYLQVLKYIISVCFYFVVISL